MAHLEMLIASAQADVLPKRCVITGEEKDVELRKVQIPSRDGGLYTLTLPFSDLAYRRWRATHLLFRLALGVSLLGFALGMIVAYFNTAMGLFVFLALVVLPIGTRKWIVQGYGPQVVRAGTKGLVVEIPNKPAAEALQAAIDEHEMLLAAARMKPGTTDG